MHCQTDGSGRGVSTKQQPITELHTELLVVVMVRPRLLAWSRLDRLQARYPTSNCAPTRNEY